MRSLVAIPFAIRLLARDRVALALLAAVWLSIPVVLAIASASDAPESSPTYYLTIGLAFAFSWRAHAVLRQSGIGYLETKILTLFLVFALCVAMIVAVVLGS
jgi:O-antigen ligase